MNSNIHINQGGDSMKKKILIPVIAGALIIIGVVLFFILRSGDDSYFSIRILYSEGNVNIKRDGNSINAAKDMKLRDKDNIIVGSDGLPHRSLSIHLYSACPLHPGSYTSLW